MRTRLFENSRLLYDERFKFEPKTTWLGVKSTPRHPCFVNSPFPMPIMLNRICFVVFLMQFIVTLLQCCFVINAFPLRLIRPILTAARVTMNRRTKIQGDTQLTLAYKADGGYFN